MPRRSESLAVVGVVLLLALVASVQTVTRNLLSGAPADFWATLRDALPPWILAAILGQAVLVLAHRYPLRRPALSSAIAAQAAGFLAFWLLQSTGSAAWVAFRWDTSFSVPLVKQMVFNVVVDLLLYGGIVLTVNALRLDREARDRALAASRLETTLQEARLAALQAQLQPHFLFNTLNAISVLALQGEKDRVVRAIAVLSDLLRLLLDTKPHQIPLRRELEIADLYLQIQHLRFPDRLRVVTEIPGETLQALVPSLLLQPLVENAVTHGVARAQGTGEIRISAVRTGEWLTLGVANSGHGTNEASPPSRGIGLSNTRERLEQLYPDRHELAFRATAEGALATVRIPFRLALEAAS